MEYDETKLPLSVQDWPVTVGGRTPSNYFTTRSSWCNDMRGNWRCSRQGNHELPHVASDGYTTLAVWDQFHYGDYNWKLPMRVVDVIPNRSVGSRTYDAAKITST
jgi:hypothetical protein